MKAAVIGMGRQGVAAAYDLASRGAFATITCADSDGSRVSGAVSRLQSLVPNKSFAGVEVNVERPRELMAFLRGVDLIVSAAPYPLHKIIEKAALEVGCSVVDMGQDTEDALAIHARNRDAIDRRLRIVTDCGVAPGLVNILALEALRRNPGAHTLRAYCGGLPIRPIPPLGYVLRFSMASVLGEYEDEVTALRNGEVVTIEPLADLEEVEFTGLGTLEAFTTSGGTGTATYTLRGKVNDFEYKTLRYPGHCKAMRLFRDCGFWTAVPVAASGEKARDVFCSLMERALENPSVPDFVIGRVVAIGPDKSVTAEFRVDQDAETRFTAMERVTGFLTAIVAHEIVAGHIRLGAQGCETAVDAGRFFAAMEARGMPVSWSETPAGTLAS